MRLLNTIFGRDVSNESKGRLSDQAFRNVAMRHALTNKLTLRASCGLGRDMYNPGKKREKREGRSESDE
jgi:hypothetical protein